MRDFGAGRPLLAKPIDGTLAPISGPKSFFGADGAALILTCFEYVNRTVWGSVVKIYFSAYNQEIIMAQVTRARELALVPKVPLLMTESGEEFAALCASLAREIKPHGIIERTYVDDFAMILWEIQRLRRCKVVIINTAFRSALENLLGQLMRSSGLMLEDLFDGRVKALALSWFLDQQCRDEVTEKLREFHLDDFAIEAEAIRISSSGLEPLDRMLSSLEARRDKALRSIAEYRFTLAKQLRQTSDRILENNDGVLCLDHAPRGKSTAA